MPFDQLLGALWRAKFAILLTGLLAATIGFVGVRLGAPRYVGEGQLLIENRRPVIPELGQAGADAPVGLSVIRTQADIFRSRQLAEDVARRLALAEREDVHGTGGGLRDRLLAAPRAWREALLDRLGAPDAPAPAEDRLADAVAGVQRGFEVRTADNSSVITLRFTAPAPRLAAEVVNAAMESYIAADLAAKEETTSRANRWLSERLVSLRSDVETADRQVQDLLRRTGLTQTAAGSTDAQQVREEQDRLATARQDVSRAQSALASAQRPGRGALTSPAIQALLDREGEIIQRRESLAQRLGERHPDRLAVEAEWRGVRRGIEAETGKVVAGLQRDLDAAQARLADAQGALTGARSTARNSQDVEIQLAGIRAEAEARRQIYQAFLLRVEQTRLAQAQFASARVISPAVPPTRPAGPPVPVTVILCGFVGLLLASTVAVARRLADRTVGSVGELTLLTGRPSAASLPALGGGIRRGMAAQVLQDGQSDVAETLRALGVALRAAVPAGEGCCALVTSPEAGDGKTTLAASLARLSAADGMRVLLIEGDMRRPQLAGVLDAPRGALGLEAVLDGRAKVHEAVHVDPGSGLNCLLTGSVRNPQALLQSDAFARLIRAARQHYQLVIIDSPPIMRVADAVIVAPHADAVLFAVGWRRNSRRTVREAMQRLPEAIRNRTATVFTRVRRGRMDPLDYYHGYSGRPAQPRLEG